MDWISDGRLFSEQRKRNHCGRAAGSIESRSQSRMLAPHVAQSNSPANQGRKTSAGDLTGFFSGRIPEKEQLRPRRGRFPVEKLQPGEPPVCMPARTNSLHDFLTRVAALLIADVG